MKDSKLMKIISDILILAAFIYMSFSLLKIFLPAQSIEQEVYLDISYAGNYSLSNIFKKQEKNSIVQKEVKPKEIKKTRKNFTYKIKALYLDKENSLVVLSDKGKSIFLLISEAHKGFKFVRATFNTAYFLNDGEEYIASIEEKNKKNKNNISKEIKSKQTVKTKKKIKQEEIIFENTLSRETLNKYKKNPSLMLKEIVLTPSQKGYIVSSLKKNSILSNFGLMKNDIIISVNGKSVNNQADLFKIYKNIAEIDYLLIETLRGSQSKEIEINIR